MRISAWSSDVCSADLGFGMASNRMLQFVARDQQYPAKRSPAARARDFREIADRYAAPPASVQSSRCEQCGVPYCRSEERRVGKECGRTFRYGWSQVYEKTK